MASHRSTRLGRGVKAATMNKARPASPTARQMRAHAEPSRGSRFDTAPLRGDAPARRATRVAFDRVSKLLTGVTAILLLAAGAAFAQAPPPPPAPEPDTPVVPAPAPTEPLPPPLAGEPAPPSARSEEHTSELQS